MTTATEIANIALGYCRVQIQIADVWADESSNAQTLRNYFAVAANAVARAYAWPEYVVQAALTETVEQPAVGTYYAYPAGALNIIRLIERAPTPQVRYQRAFDLKKELPDALQEVLALSLAYHVSSAIAHDNNLKNQLNGEYLRALKEAQLFYARQDKTDRSIYGEPEDLAFEVLSLADGTKVIHVPPQRDYAGFVDFADAWSE